MVSLVKRFNVQIVCIYLISMYVNIVNLSEAE